MSDKTWRSTLTIKLAVIALLLFPLGALGTKLAIWPFTTGFLVLAIGMLLSLVTLVIGAIYIFKDAYSADRAGLRNASLLAFLPMALLAFIFASAGSVPRIHNITTNLDNPPAFSAVIALRGENSNPLELTDAVKEAHKAGYPELQPVVTSLSAEQATNKAAEIATELGWNVHPQSRKNYVEATVTSFWFGFSDDVVIRITPANGGSIIDLRSVSRVGKSDLGANAKRISQFIANFSQ